jgi:parvulin-like peptidyl-prolyl isomerase
MKLIGNKVGMGLFFIALIMGFSLWSMRAWADVKEEEIVAKVGNYVITNADLAEMVNKYQEFRKNRPFTIEEKKIILDNFVKNLLIVQEAEKLKFDKKPSVEIQLKLLKVELLMKEYVSSLVEPQIKVTDTEIEDYLKQTPDLIPKETLTLREIVVKTEEEAKKIIQDLKKGAPFSELATDKSIAPSKRNGGRIGMISRGKLPKALEDVAFKLKVGEFSGPVKTDQGYTILYLDERKERTQKEMDELKGKIKAKLEQLVKARKIEEVMEKKVQELSKNTKVEKYYERIK